MNKKTTSHSTGSHLGFQTDSGKTGCEQSQFWSADTTAGPERDRLHFWPTSTGLKNECACARFGAFRSFDQ